MACGLEHSQGGFTNLVQTVVAVAADLVASVAISFPITYSCKEHSEHFASPAIVHESNTVVPAQFEKNVSSVQLIPMQCFELCTSSCSVEARNKLFGLCEGTTENKKSFLGISLHSLTYFFFPKKNH